MAAMNYVTLSLLIAAQGSSNAPASPSAPPRPPAQGLLGATPLGDPKVAAFENELAKLIHDRRKQAGAQALTLDPSLRAFARREAEAAAKGEAQAGSADARIKGEKLAPFGYKFQFVFGAKAQQAFADLTKDAASRAMVEGDFTRLGVGGFYVPVDKPYFQAFVLFVADQDPRAGQPGLAKGETDPVMNAAASRIKMSCYDPLLEQSPNFKGEVLFQVTIGGDGRVSDAKVLKTIGNGFFDGCALEQVKRCVFPAPYKGRPVTLNHPMRFLPPQGEKIVGRLTKAQIAEALVPAEKDLQACYETALAAKKGKLAGTLELRVVVEPTGKVAEVSVARDGLADETLAACAVERAKRLLFSRPQFDAGVEIVVPLKFAPATEGKYKR